MVSKISKADRERCGCDCGGGAWRTGAPGDALPDGVGPLRLRRRNRRWRSRGGSHRRRRRVHPGGRGVLVPCAAAAWRAVAQNPARRSSTQCATLPVSPDRAHSRHGSGSRLRRSLSRPEAGDRIWRRSRPSARARDAPGQGLWLCRPLRGPIPTANLARGG